MSEYVESLEMATKRMFNHKKAKEDLLVGKTILFVSLSKAPAETSAFIFNYI